MSVIARLGVILGLDSVEFQKGLDEATKKTKDFEKNQKVALKNAQSAASEMAANFAKASVAVGALGVAFIKVIQYGDELKKTADTLNITLENLISIRGALGGEATQLDAMLNRLAASQDNAREGSDQLREAFTRLGISGRDVDNLSLDELFKRIAVELSKVEDSTKRTAIAQDLLGKAAKGVDWAGFASDYRKFADPAIVTAINENAKAWQNIEKTMMEIGLLVQKLTAPFSALLNMMFDLVDQYNKIKEGGDVDVDWGAAFGGMPGQEGSITAHKGKGKAPTSPIAKTPKAGGYGKLSKKEEAEAEARRKALLKEQEEFLRLIEQQQEKVAAYRAQLAALSVLHQSNMYNATAGYEIEKKRLALESQIYDLTKDQYESRKFYLEQSIRLFELEKQKTLDMAKAREELERADKNSFQLAQGIYEEKIKNIEQYYGLQANLIKETNRIEADVFHEMQDRQYDFAKGFVDTMRQSAHENEKIYRFGAESFNSVMGNMNMALDTFVRTGKLSFKDFAKSVISDLIAIAMKAQAISFLSNIFLAKGTVGMGTPKLDSGGGFVGGGYGSIGVPGFASGGAIGGPAIVGENGPELFIPTSPGTVVPNGSWQQMASRPAGMTVNGPYIANLSTIDSKSFEDRIYESNKAIWAAGKYAEKSLASGGRA